MATFWESAAHLVYCMFSLYFDLGQQKINVCLFPTYPNFFPATLKFLLVFQKNEMLSHSTYPTCGHFLLVLPLSLSYFSSVLLVTGPNRPLFIIYLWEKNASVVFLVKSGKMINKI